MGSSKTIIKNESNSLLKQAILLTSLLLVGLIVVYFVPKISNFAFPFLKKDSFVSTQDIISLVLLSSITVIFLSYYRTKAFFSSKWLIAATTYNVLILLIKFTLSKNEINSGSSNFSTILSAVIAVSFLYILGLFVLFMFFNGRILSKTTHRALIASNEGKVLLTSYIFVFITIMRVVLYHLPGLRSTTAASYLGDVFKPKTYLLSLLIFLIIYTAVEAYGQVRRRKDLLDYFVTSSTLILVFHIWWGLYTYRIIR
jgi:hypothetical protein